MLMFHLLSIMLISVVMADSSKPTLREVVDRLMRVEARLKESEEEIVVLRETTLSQKELINYQEKRINQLENDVDSLNVFIRTNQGKIISNTREIKSLRNRLQRHAQTQTPSKHNEAKKTEASERSKIRSSGEDNIEHISRKNRRQAVGGGIAFTAYMNHDGDFGAGQTIVFNKIITNDGDGYNTHTGIFTCPEEGVYFFTFSVGERADSDGTRQIWADLILNSQNVVDAVAEVRQVNEDDQGGNSVVIRLKQGDSVWVRSRFAGHQVEGSASRITTFTGMYLYA